MVDEKKAIKKKKERTIKDVRRKFYQRLNYLLKHDDVAKRLYDHIRFNNENTFQQISREEIRRFDERWIKAIESGVTAIEKIIKDPKKFIKTERNVVPIELAKKTTAESVMHLSSHSQFVKDIDENGNVIPSKILNITAEDDYAIYENRFIKCLVDRLAVFMEIRYEYLTNHVLTLDSDFMKVTAKVKMDEATYEIESKVKVSIPGKDAGKRDKNEALMRKIALLRRRIQFLSQSEFMERLKDSKPIPFPVKMTNILRKNVDYHEAYKLSKFLDEYDQFGIRIRVKETQKEFTNKYIEELMKYMFVSSLSMEQSKFKRKPQETKTRKHVVKPKLIRVVQDPLVSDAKFNQIDPQYADYLSPEQKTLLKKEEALKEKRKKEQLRKERMALRALQEKEQKRLMALKEKERRRLLQEKILEQKKLEEEKKKKERERLLLERKEKQRLEKEKQKEKELLAKERERIRRTALEEKAKEEAKQKRKEQQKSEKAKQKEKVLALKEGEPVR